MQHQPVSEALTFTLSPKCRPCMLTASSSPLHSFYNRSMAANVCLNSILDTHMSSVVNETKHLLNSKWSRGWENVYNIFSQWMMFCETTRTCAQLVFGHSNKKKGNMRQMIWPLLSHSQVSRLTMEKRTRMS